VLTKYLNAAKDTADHVVLSPTASASRWARPAATGPTRARQSFGSSTPTSPRRRQAARTVLLAATLRHREALASGKLEEVAAKEKLNAKYLGMLWQALNEKTPSQPLDSIRAKWRAAAEKDVQHSRPRWSLADGTVEDVFASAVTCEKVGDQMLARADRESDPAS